MNTAGHGSDLDVVFPRPYHEPLGQLDRGSGTGAAAVPEAGAEVGKRAALGHSRGAAGAAGLHRKPAEVCCRARTNILPAVTAQPIRPGPPRPSATRQQSPPARR